MSIYQTITTERTDYTIRIRRTALGEWQPVDLVAIRPGWVSVDSDGPLWVMVTPGQVHPADLRRLAWLRLPRGE